MFNCLYENGSLLALDRDSYYNFGCPPEAPDGSGSYLMEIDDTDQVYSGTPAVRVVVQDRQPGDNLIYGPPVPEAPAVWPWLVGGALLLTFLGGTRVRR